MKREMLFHRVACAALAAFIGSDARAINVVIDDRYDVSDFFDPGTPNGALARATINQAALFFSTIIDDTLAAIPYYDPLTPGGSNTPVWRQSIMHPGTGQTSYDISSAASAAQDGLTVPQGAANEFRDLQVPANQYTLYIGATSLSSAGIGGTGVGYFGSTAFNQTIGRRGKPEGEFAAWGGYVSFDDDGGANWHYDHSTPVAAGKTDLYSVALHEIGHALGLNGSYAEWTQWQVGPEFQGPQALAAWKADDPSAPSGATGVPTVSASNFHWKDNAATPPFAPRVSSYVLGTTQLQEAAMDPVIINGSRKLFTNVDAMALRDIGWTVPDSVFDVTESPADFNGDDFVDGEDLADWELAFDADDNGGDADGDGDSDGADFLIWQRELTVPPAFPTGAPLPEPSGGLLAAVGGGVLLALRRRKA